MLVIDDFADSVEVSRNSKLLHSLLTAEQYIISNTRSAPREALKGMRDANFNRILCGKQSNTILHTIHDQLCC